MSRVSQMQGTPAHIEFLKSNDKVRRHPAHCIYAEGTGKSRICSCPQSKIYNMRCKSCKNCDYYEEK